MTIDPREMEALLREAATRLGTRLPRRLQVAFRPLSEAYFRTTARGGELKVVVNDAFSDAPGKVMAAMAEVIVARAARAAKPREVGAPFWEFTETDGLRDRMQRNYLARQRSFSADPRGREWDLVTLFEGVNEAYFEGALGRPMLGWTLRPITYRWGWYSSMVRPRGLIVINCLLDDPQVPRFVLEGTMHHEMLHMRTDAMIVNGRRVVHTREFREAERAFERFSELRPEYRNVLSRYAGSLSSGGVRDRGRRGGR